MRNKYGAVRVTIDGITFASKAEARRYQELKLAERAGEIESLVLQPVFLLVVNGVKVGKYIADFSYYIGEKKIIEDVKGVKTSVYRLKKKIAEALYGIKILETQ